MPKRSQEKEKLFNTERAGVWWEGLRRNDEYKSDYDLFLNKVSKMGDGSPKNKYIKAQRIIFKEKYGVDEPVNPSISFYKMFNAVRKNFKERLKKDYSLMVTRESPDSVLLSFESNNNMDGSFKALFCERIEQMFRNVRKGILSVTRLEPRKDKDIFTLVINNKAKASLILSELEAEFRFWYVESKEAKNKSKSVLHFCGLDKKFIIYDELKSRKSIKSILLKHYGSTESNVRKQFKIDIDRIKDLVESKGKGVI